MCDKVCCPWLPVVLLQTLEVSSREGSLAAGQLEETRKRLQSAQRQLDVLNEDHLQTLNKLEAAQVGGLVGRQLIMRPVSSWSVVRGSGAEGVWDEWSHCKHPIAHQQLHDDGRRHVPARLFLQPT